VRTIAEVLGERVFRMIGRPLNKHISQLGARTSVDARVKEKDVLGIE
jgi:hypothetical protein